MDAGTIGELYYVESEYAHDYAKILNGWRDDPNRHGLIGGGCQRPYTMRTLIYGTTGTIICDNTSPELTLYTLYANDISVNPTPQMIPVGGSNHNTQGAFAVFADCILNGKPVEMDALYGAQSIAICLAIVESAKTGKPVVPDYNF